MTPTEARAAHRRQIAQHGETVTLRRYSGTGNARSVAAEADVLARVVGYQPAELIGLVQQGDRKLIVLAEDVEAGAVTAPIVKGDKAVVRGRELNIEGVDDNTRRIGGTLIAYELQVRG